MPGTPPASRDFPPSPPTCANRWQHEFRHAVLAGLASVPRVPGPKNTRSRSPAASCSNSAATAATTCSGSPTDTSIWPTNNISERGVRPLKTQQKISGRLASDDVTQDRLDIRSYIDTARKHGKNAYGRPARPHARQPLATAGPGVLPVTTRSQPAPPITAREWAECLLLTVKLGLTRFDGHPSSGVHPRKDVRSWRAWGRSPGAAARSHRSSRPRSSACASKVTGPWVSGAGATLDRPFFRPDISQLAWIVRELCAVGGRCCQRLAAAVAAPLLLALLLLYRWSRVRLPPTVNKVSRR